MFIVVAFAGIEAMHPDSIWFLILQIAGCMYLLYLGVLFICCAGDGTLHLPATKRHTSTTTSYGAWWRALGMGFLSGILNPKNALFYASLVTMLTEPYAISVGWKVFYGGWMFSVVALWDVLVAVMIGHHTVLQRFARLQPWLERVSGVMLILLALAVLAAMILYP